jgi:hypothetical protein
MEAIAVPIKPGKLETWKSWCGELTGARKAEFDDMNQRLGLTTHASWHQANPDGSDLALVVIDGPGADTFLGKIGAATADAHPPAVAVPRHLPEPLNAKSEG